MGNTSACSLPIVRIVVRVTLVFVLMATLRKDRWMTTLGPSLLSTVAPQCIVFKPCSVAVDQTRVWQGSCFLTSSADRLLTQIDFSAAVHDVPVVLQRQASDTGDDLPVVWQGTLVLYTHLPDIIDDVPVVLPRQAYTIKKSCFLPLLMCRGRS